MQREHLSKGNVQISRPPARLSGIRIHGHWQRFNIKMCKDVQPYREPAYLVAGLEEEPSKVLQLHSAPWKQCTAGKAEASNSV